MKAQRNKTIDFSLEEGKPYLEKCISVTEKKSVPEIINRTINGDTLSVTPFLPHKFVDLLIADPPYNMDKDFGGGKFRNKFCHNLSLPFRYDKYQLDHSHYR